MLSSFPTPMTDAPDFNAAEAVRKMRLEFEQRLERLKNERETVLPVSPDSGDVPFVSKVQRRDISLRHIFRSLREKVPYRGRFQKTAEHQRLEIVRFRFPSFSVDIAQYANTLLTLIGIAGLTFASMCLIRGWHSDLSLGYPVSAAGLLIIGTGILGRLFSRCE